MKDIVKFDLERLRGKKVAVNCGTEEQFQNFIDWVNSLKNSDFNKNTWYIYEGDSYLTISWKLVWSYCDKSYFKELDYEIISYEEALLKGSNEEPNSNKDLGKISLTTEQLKKFYLEAYNAGGLSKIVCGGLSDKDINSLDDISWMKALVKAYN